MLFLLWTRSNFSSYFYQVNEEELKESVILVFANKQDLPNALSTSELTEKLGLHNLRGRQVKSAHFSIILHWSTCFVRVKMDVKQCSYIKGAIGQAADISDIS